MPSQSEVWRLFIAIELPDEVRLALRRMQTRLKQADREAIIRWTNADGIHLTLKFLGETPATQEAAIRRALYEAAQGHASFALELASMGCFPNTRRPRVVWAGVNGALDALSALRDAVERTVAPLGFPTGTRPFSPHLTLGRVRQGASPTALAALGTRIDQAGECEPVGWQVTGLSLMRSDLRPTGAVYSQVAHIPLAHEGGIKSRPAE
jgi:2'-5' RNA ligase